MNRKVAGLCGAFLALAGVAAASRAQAGVEAFVSAAPGPLLVRPSTGAAGGFVSAPTDGNASWSEFNCVEIDYHGWLRMHTGCGNASGSTWRRGYITVPEAANPSSGQSVGWSGSAPASTKLAGRAVSYNSDGTLAASTGFTYGGGWKSDTVSPRGDGAIFLEIAMQSTVLPTSPQLFIVGSNVYSN